MTRKMQAAKVEQFGRPLVLKEFEIPTPAAAEILGKTEACGNRSGNFQSPGNAHVAH